MTRATLALALTALGFTACTETIVFDQNPLGSLIAIEVVPGDALVEINGLAPPFHTLQYEAMGRFSDGSTRTITDAVTWAIDRDLLGQVDERGLFVASHAAAGYGTIAARFGGVAGTGAIKVTIDATIIDPTFPPPAAGLFDPSRPVVTGDPTRAPAMVYPSDGTVLPRVIASTLFQLEPGTGNDAFALGFENDVLRLRVETGADRWSASGDVQRLLAASAGVDPLGVTLHATSSTGSTVYAGAPMTIGFSGDLADALLYYWSSGANGIMRGSVDRSAASKVGTTSTTCVGCHTLNKAGTKLAYGVDNGSGTTFALETLETATDATQIRANPSRPMGWAAYSPDGLRLVVATAGVLTQYDAASGAVIGAVPLPAQRYATHPDWAPSGTSLAVALTAQEPTDMDVRAASIAIIPFTNGTWGAPTILVDGAATNNNYFPRWSPDGSVLAYVRATTSSRGAASAQLMLVDATGGAPRALAIANQRVGDTTLTDLANTMPAWAPQIGARTWLAFASKRAYGKVVANGPSQIWITSLDLSASGDPSTPAFWLPCQDVTVLNNNPVWSGQLVSTQ